MSQAAKKVLYFISGRQPTALEQQEIDRLSTVFSSVQIRSGKIAAESVFGDTHIESFDFLAGTDIPTAYSGAEGAVVLSGIPSGTNPDQFKVFPAAVTLNHVTPDTQQLGAVKAVVSASTGLAVMTDLAADASVTYVSSDATKATVSSTGKVTSVAAGATTITATLTAGTPVTTVTATGATDLVNKAAHGFVQGDKVRLTATTGAAGLAAGTDYYVIARSSIIVDPVNTFKLATTFANAEAGTAIDITSDGSSMTFVKSPVTSTCAVTVS